MEPSRKTTEAGGNCAASLIRWKRWVRESRATVAFGVLLVVLPLLAAWVIGGFLAILGQGQPEFSDLARFLLPSDLLSLAVVLGVGAVALGALLFAGGGIAYTIASGRYDAHMNRVLASKSTEEAVVDSLAARLGDKSDTAYGAAISVLGDIGNRRATPWITSALEDERESVRRSAVEALGRLWDASATDPLVGALQDTSESVRKEAASVLGRFRWQPRNDIERVRFLAAKGKWDKLAELGEAALGPLLELLQDKSAPVRSKAAWALGEVGDARALEPLRRAVNDEDAGVRVAAKAALMTIEKGQQS